MNFIEMWGNAFGFSAAVVNYNRDPECLVNMCRCLLGCVCTHFYDDHLSIDHSAGQGSTQSAYVKLCRLLGKTLDEQKHENMASTFTFTGCQVRVH